MTKIHRPPLQDIGRFGGSIAGVIVEINLVCASGLRFMRSSADMILEALWAVAPSIAPRMASLACLLIAWAIRASLSIGQPSTVVWKM